MEVGQPLQVVADCHHRHRKVRARLSRGADQLAAHLLHRRKRMFDPYPRLCNPLITPLLPLGQWLVAMTFELNLDAVAVRFKPDLTRLRWIAPVCKDISTRVSQVHDRLKVHAVLGAGRVSDDLADELVLLVNATFTVSL